DLAALARRAHARLVLGSARLVDRDARLVGLGGGRPIGYDELIVAVGARRAAAYDHGATFDPVATDLRLLARRMHNGDVRSVAIVVPPAVGWTLPAYELALLLRRVAGARAAIALLTPEDTPLHAFGPHVSDAIADLLAGAGVELHTSAYCMPHSRGRVSIRPHLEQLVFDRVISMPVLHGPGLAGLPADRDGFLPTDRRGRVIGAPHVHAAGDATTFPVKQGGLATQEADAAAADVVRALGADVPERQFRPVLRGKLVIDGTPRFLHHPAHGGAGEGSISTSPLWSPAEKLGGRLLTPALRRGGGGLSARPATELESLTL
ncbi:MAG TPA: FAD-dependent oxidoreductase, partial [Solirubrobacteraceae bacterium]|nr:FAD-dependent oxidoreductase [Solirubrobacteraceae bacterium]